jgi:hypothetical protein
LSSKPTSKSGLIPLRNGGFGIAARIIRHWLRHQNCNCIECSIAGEIPFAGYDLHRARLAEKHAGEQRHCAGAKEVLTRKFLNPSKISLTSSPALLRNHADASVADLPWKLSTSISSGFAKPRRLGTCHCNFVRSATPIDRGTFPILAVLKEVGQLCLLN